MKQDYTEKAQQIMAKNEVALGTGGGTFTFAALSDLATLAEQVGMICGGILSILVLCNWLYVHIFKKKKDNTSA